MKEVVICFIPVLLTWGWRISFEFGRKQGKIDHQDLIQARMHELILADIKTIDLKDDLQKYWEDDIKQMQQKIRHDFGFYNHQSLILMKGITC